MKPAGQGLRHLAGESRAATSSGSVASATPSHATTTGQSSFAVLGPRGADVSPGEVARDHRVLGRGRRSRAHILVPIAIFAGITALLAADLLSDFHAGHGPVHFVLEVGAGVLALVGLAFFVQHAWEIHGVAHDLERDLQASEAEALRWREEAHQALEGLGAAIDREFDKWDLTEAERSVALMLLKGLSHRKIATGRGTSEGTVRQQALAIYRKAGLTGRSSLAAFFLAGLVLPTAPSPQDRHD